LDAELEQITLEMIAHAGEARSLVFDSLRLAEEGEFEQARETLEQVSEPLGAVHSLQTRLLQREAQRTLPPGSVLLVHAQDLLMAAMTERDLTERMLKLYYRVHCLEVAGGAAAEHGP
jgi:PTS system cellobiose-specific IIA component